MSKNKLLGANFCMKNKADLIIMDDGLQSKDIKKDFKILIIDGDYEFGNNLLFPAGPLRQSLNEILSEVDLIIIIGTYKKSFTKILKNRKIFCAKKIIELNCKNKNLFAFSGLGNNSNFFNLIKKSDYKLQRIKEFSDHHFYKNSEIESMISEAEKANLQLVCTMKDYLKIDEQFKNKIYPVQMKIDIKNERDLLKNIIKTLSN